MRFLFSRSLAALFGLSLALPAIAQNATPAPPTAISATAPPTLTGKERLGRKWTDEQRIDNCNVPVELRGTRLRPSICPHVPTS